MHKLEGKVAVITGAASGIGLGMAEEFAHRGMKVVMADVETDALQEQTDRLKAANYDVIACHADVVSEQSMENLLATAIESYGIVHVLCNNAGVSGSMGGAAIWESSQKDWQWVMGVNLQGVLNGIRVFMPHLLSHGQPGHVVNTSSILGLTTGGGSIYGISKHAVARLTEGMYYDLQSRNAQIGTSLLCPGLIATNIIQSARNRPAELTDEGKLDASRSEQMQRVEEYFKTEGMPPRRVGEIVADGIENNQFYLLTHPENMEGIDRRFKDIMSFTNPTPPPTATIG